METNIDPVVRPEDGAMSRFAETLIRRFGNTREARERFWEKAKAVDPPLDENEAKTVWLDGMLRLKAITAQESVSPKPDDDPTPRKPDDFTDVGQAHSFAKHCRDHVRYSPATDYLVYDGICWQESKSRVQGALHEFTEDLWNGLIDHVTVHADERLVFVFKNGKEIVETL